jgi:hypothetical protein
LAALAACRLVVAVGNLAGVAHQYSMAIPELVQSGWLGHSAAHHNYRRTPHRAWQVFRIANKPLHYWPILEQLVESKLPQILLQE